MSPEDVDLGDSPLEGIKDVGRQLEEDGGLGRELQGEAQERASEAPVLLGGDDLTDAEVEELIRRLSRRRSKTRRTILPAQRRRSLNLEQRLLLLDTWVRSKLPAKDFSAMVGVSSATLYKWKRCFELDGPAGLRDRKRGAPRGSRLSDVMKRAILLLKQAHEDWGQDRIADVLCREAGFSASPGTIGRYLLEEGYEVEEVPTRPHPDKKRRFERSRPNELWQTDLFSFMLKRENRRVHLVGFMDDYSRYIVGYGLHASASGALVQECFQSAIANFGKPKEVLTDNGTQYHTWRGKSAFRKLCDRLGVQQVVARPRHPQTLGKIERFWGTLWRELLVTSIFRGIDEARVRIGHFIDAYNFQRPHQGIDGLVPADRFFGAESQVRQTLMARVDANAMELAQHGEPRKPFYLTGRVGDSNLSLHAEGDRVVMTKADGTREEVDLAAVGPRRVDQPVAEEGSPSDPPATQDDSLELPPGESPLDAGLRKLSDAFGEEE